MFKYYIFFIIISVLHELGHYMAIKYFKINIESIVIGNGIHIKIKKLKISPIILSSHIEFSIEEYERLKLIKRLIIIISGPIVNFIIFMILPREQVVFRYISLLIGITSLIPIPFLNTDGMNIIKEVVKLRKKQLVTKL